MNNTNCGWSVLVFKFFRVEKYVLNIQKVAVPEFLFFISIPVYAQNT